MPFRDRFRFLPRQPVVLVALAGAFDLDRSFRLLDRIEAEPRWGPGYGLIWDARARTSLPATDDVRRMVQRFRPWHRVAIVTRPPAQYGMARMASALGDNTAGGFDTPRDAWGWVRGEDIPLGPWPRS